MDIVSRFQVHFTQNRQGQDVLIPADRFFYKESEMFEHMEETYVEIIENFETNIVFQSEADGARLYLDGLEVITERLIATDEHGEAYLIPSPEPIVLFNHTQEFYPLIPGYYRLRVMHEGRNFYTCVKIVPKQMKEMQLDIMKSELEEELQGLAHDVFVKKANMNGKSPELSRTLLGQFEVINHRFASVMAALTDLYRKANYRISKEIAQFPVRRSERYDTQKVIRPQYGHMPSSLTFDLPENRMAKKIIEDVTQKLSLFIDAVDRLQRELSSSKALRSFRTEVEKQATIAEFESLLERAKKMRGAFHWIKTAPWYKDVSSVPTTSMPHVMHSDARYRSLFQLSRELESEEIQKLMDQFHIYQWKRTDKLYEIWGFIKLVKLLTSEEVGYTPVKGWIFNGNQARSAQLIRTLPSNTVIEFEQGDWRIHLVYDELLPTESKLTLPKKPLFTRGTNNCPDTRIDLYKLDVYMGSVIVDFKYRPQKSIWDQQLITLNQQNRTMKQLISYGNLLHSPFLFGESSNHHHWLREVNPIQEVWALFPSHFGSAKSVLYSDHKVRLLEFTPGFNHSHVCKELKAVLEKLKEKGEFALKMQRVGIVQ